MDKTNQTNIEIVGRTAVLSVSATNEKPVEDLVRLLKRVTLMVEAEGRFLDTIHMKWI